MGTFRGGEEDQEEIIKKKKQKDAERCFIVTFILDLKNDRIVVYTFFK